MGDSLTTIIAIFLAAVLMFIFPLAAIADRNDDTSQMYVQTTLDNFVNTVAAKGKLTNDDYEKLESTLAATNNSYDIELKIDVKDVNPGKKTGNQKLGDTTYYSVYTSQIIDSTTGTVKNNVYYLKEGDYITVSVKNINKTISQMIKNVLYGITGNESYVIAGQASGVVVTTGYTTGDTTEY